MNILIVLAVAAFAVCLLWAVQSIVLTILGEPLTWPLRFAHRQPLLRWTSRVMIPVSWLIFLFAPPLARVAVWARGLPAIPSAPAVSPSRLRAGRN